MKKLQAAMKDIAAKKYRREAIHMYRVGSYFKGCCQCGEVEWVETKGGNLVKRYRSGYDVFRAYDPRHLGWTWWCYTCGAKDLRCWEPDEHGFIEYQLGKPPLMGNRDAKRGARDYIIAQLEAAGVKVVKTAPKPEPPPVTSTASALEQLIKKLQEKLREKA